MTVVALHHTGELIRCSAVARDVTTHLEAQQQLERLARCETHTGLASRVETTARLDVARRRPRNGAINVIIIISQSSTK